MARLANLSYLRLVGCSSSQSEAWVGKKPKKTKQNATKPNKSKMKKTNLEQKIKQRKKGKNQFSPPYIMLSQVQAKSLCLYCVTLKLWELLTLVLFTLCVPDQRQLPLELNKEFSRWWAVGCAFIPLLSPPGWGQPTSSLWPTWSTVNKTK